MRGAINRGPLKIPMEGNSKVYLCRPRPTALIQLVGIPPLGMKNLLESKA